MATLFANAGASFLSVAEISIRKLKRYRPVLSSERFFGLIAAPQTSVDTFQADL